MLSSAASSNTQHRYIITGGPGVGKTSIINCLKNAGHSVIQEAATHIIAHDLSQGIQKPWEKPGFDDRILKLQEERQVEALAKKTNYVFFDRSPIDTFSYCDMYQNSSVDTARKSVKRILDQDFYQTTVFLIENLGFCEQDEIRCETLNQTLKIEKILEENYKKLGFKIIRIPPMPIDERAKLIISHIQPSTSWRGFLNTLFQRIGINFSRIF